MSVIAGIANGVASIGGSLLQNRLNQQAQAAQNKWNEQQQAKANAYNSPAAQMARLQAAGLSAFAAQNAIAGVSPVAATAAQGVDPFAAPNFAENVQDIAGNQLTERMQNITDEQNQRQSRIEQQSVDQDRQLMWSQLRKDKQTYDFYEQMNDLKITNQKIVNQRGLTDNALALAGFNVFIHSHGLNEDGTISGESIKLYADQFKADMEAKINASSYDAEMKKKMLAEVDIWYNLAVNKQYAEIGLAVAMGDEAAYNGALKKMTKEEIDKLPAHLRTWALCGDDVGYLLDYENGNEQAIESYEDKKRVDAGQDYTAVVDAHFSAGFNSKTGLSVKAGQTLRGEKAKTYNEYERERRKEQKKKTKKMVKGVNSALSMLKRHVKGKAKRVYRNAKKKRR